MDCYFYDRIQWNNKIGVCLKVAIDYEGDFHSSEPQIRLQTETRRCNVCSVIFPVITTERRVFRMVAWTWPQTNAD